MKQTTRLWDVDGLELCNQRRGFTQCVQSESGELLKWKHKHETNPNYAPSLSFQVCWHEG